MVSLGDQKVASVDLNCKWVIVNNKISALCFVIYSKLLLQCLVLHHNQDLISEGDEYLIQVSIDSEAFSELHEEGMTDLYDEKFRSE